MARLRVRIELNRRMAGVPLDKMASVVEETRKFFYLLAEDVQIEADRGEWLASDFDAESLNFTAEYAGPVSAEQAHAFGAAFAGATSLRKTTIAQFTRIADFLGEDELVGFGLYQSDQENEPTEWRCLSKRDAYALRRRDQAAGASCRRTATGDAIARGNEREHRRTPSFQGPARARALGGRSIQVVREMESNCRGASGCWKGNLPSKPAKCSRSAAIPTPPKKDFRNSWRPWKHFGRKPPPVSSIAFSSDPAPSRPPARTRNARLVGFRRHHRSRGRHPGWSRLSRFAAPVGALRFRGNTPHGEAPAAGRARSTRDSILPELRRATRRQNGGSAIGRALRRPPDPARGPRRLKPKIQSEVRVDVVVAIDEEGKVTAARVASTKGESAALAGDGSPARRPSIQVPSRSGGRENRPKPDDPHLPLQAGKR